MFILMFDFGVWVFKVFYDEWGNWFIWLWVIGGNLWVKVELLLG